MSARLALLVLACCIASLPALGQTQPASATAVAGTTATQGAQAPFDIKAATDAYLAKVPPGQRARSDAYFEGGYWLTLWNFVYISVLMWLFLYFRWSVRMRNLAERITRLRPLQTAIYWVQFIVVAVVLYFPMSVYEGYVREHKYGLATQTFGPWLWDHTKGVLVVMVLGSLFLPLLFGVLRRLPRTWWIWGAVVVVVYSAFITLIVPVYVAPLFNHYTRLNDPQMTTSILSMARANGIPVQEVYEVDASRQSTRVSAFVFGFLNTQRIVLSDNLLKRCTLPEIEAVVGHEIGHYVLNHIYKGLLFSLVSTVIAFACLRYALGWSLARWGERWQVRGVGDLAVLPLVVLLLNILIFVSLPIDNTVTRTMEYEADIFGLNAARQPDGEAEVDLKLGEYRKLDPGRVEEWLFYDHPSGRARIQAAMRWKAEHLAEMPPSSGAGN